MVNDVDLVDGVTANHNDDEDNDDDNDKHAVSVTNSFTQKNSRKFSLSSTRDDIKFSARVD